MKCFVVFLMTLVVVNSFPLKNDEDSSLKRKVMSEIQQLCYFQMESLKILFSRLENLYWCLVNDQGYCWCLFINLFLWLQTTSRPYCFCFKLFHAESRIGTRSKAFATILILYRCWLLFDHISKFFCFLRFCAQMPIAEYWLVSAILKHFLVLFANRQNTDFWCLSNDKFPSLSWSLTTYTALIYWIC